MVLRLLRRHQNTIGVVAYVTLMKNGVPTLMILLISTCDFDEYIFYNEFIAVAEIGMVADSGSGMIEKSSSAFYYFLLFDFLDIFLFLLLFFNLPSSFQRVLSSRNGPICNPNHPQARSGWGTVNIAES